MAKSLVVSALMTWVCFSFLFAVRCQSSTDEEPIEEEAYMPSEENIDEQLNKGENSGEKGVLKQSEAEEDIDTYQDEEGTDKQSSDEKGTDMQYSDEKGTDMQSSDEEGTDKQSSDEELENGETTEVLSKEDKDTYPQYDDNIEKEVPSIEDEDAVQQYSTTFQDEDRTDVLNEDYDDGEKGTDMPNEGEKGIGSTNSPPPKGDEKNNGNNGWSWWTPYPIFNVPSFPGFQWPSQHSPLGGPPGMGPPPQDPARGPPGMGPTPPGGFWFSNGWNPLNWMAYGGNNPYSSFRPVGQPSEQRPPGGTSEKQDSGGYERIRKIK